MKIDDVVVTRGMEAVGEAIIDNHYEAVGSDYLARLVYIAMVERARYELRNQESPPPVPPWEDFGHEMNNLLNQIGWYCRENQITLHEAEAMFNVGIAGKKALSDSA